MLEQHGEGGLRFQGARPTGVGRALGALAGGDPRLTTDLQPPRRGVATKVVPASQGCWPAGTERAARGRTQRTQGIRAPLNVARLFEAFSKFALLLVGIQRRQRAGAAIDGARGGGRPANAPPNPASDGEGRLQARGRATGRAGTSAPPSIAVVDVRTASRPERSNQSRERHPFFLATASWVTVNE